MKKIKSSKNARLSSPDTIVVLDMNEMWHMKTLANYIHSIPMIIRGDEYKVLKEFMNYAKNNLSKLDSYGPHMEHNGNPPPRKIRMDISSKGSKPGTMPAELVKLMDKCEEQLISVFVDGEERFTISWAFDGEVDRRTMAAASKKVLKPKVSNRK